MADCTEDQQNEVEALQSIYYNEFEDLKQDLISFRIKIDSDLPLKNGRKLSFYIKFLFPKSYPNVIPEIDYEEYEQIEDELMNDLREIVSKLAKDSIGMPMIYLLVSRVKDWIENYTSQQLEKIEREEENTRRAEENTENARYRGTPVTRETFLEWKKAFDAEIMTLRKEKVKIEEAERKGRLTGKQLFEKDATLAASDATFWEEGDVAVDESLFNGIDLEEEGEEEKEDKIQIALSDSDNE